MRRFCGWISFILLISIFSPILRADDLESLEQKSVAAAVQRAAPSVVRVETIGGLERVEGVTFGTGPTTGWIVDPEGYVVSSAFNFSNRPSSILVRLPDGSRKSAKLVATDHSRKIVLLKIETSSPLPVCEIAPVGEMRVGQTVVALGRAFEGGGPNISRGMLSALGRVWGKAIQFDASASPNNYGGLLIDIRGRAMGVIVPLAPDSADETAGVEWYDSGIGFAVPAEHLMSVLPRLKKGEDLRPGYTGFAMKDPNLYAGEPVLGSCRGKSPAAEAGLKVGDRIVEIDGRKIARSAEVKEEISRRYAGDKIQITVERGREKPERVKSELTLVEKLENYRHPFLGILPMRDNSKDGVAVRYVYPDGPAAKAGVAAGDKIVFFAGKPVEGNDSLYELLKASEPKQSVEIEYRRDAKANKAKVVLSALPENLPPDELPPAREKSSAAEGQKPATGTVKIKIAEYPNETTAYVPDDYDPAQPLGAIVWLHGSGGYKWDEALALWKPICDRYGMILIAPKAADPSMWMPAEQPFVAASLAEIRRQYSIDPLRIAAFGQETGGNMASLAAFRDLDAFRAWVAVDVPLAATPPEIDPAHRFAVYLFTAKKSRQAKPVEATMKLLRDLSIPLTEKPLGDSPRPPKPDELEQFVRWVDMLDRM
jgi:serine protease Do